MSGYSGNATSTNVIPIARDDGWMPIETAPAETTVIAWGQGGMRFMRKDKWGQWRNMMNVPRSTPRFWMPLPAPPGGDR